MHNVVWNDQWKNIQEISAEVRISIGRVHRIRHKDLNMHYLWQHLVPWLCWRLTLMLRSRLIWIYSRRAYIYIFKHNIKFALLSPTSRNKELWTMLA
jgi:hypothetical protein